MDRTNKKPLMRSRVFRGFRAKLALGAVLLGTGAFLYLRVRVSICDDRWPRMRYGMTGEEVRALLGSPTRIGEHSIRGVGDRPTTRWIYVLPGRRFHVDFDYTGPAGAPEVFRLEREVPR